MALFDTFKKKPAEKKEKAASPVVKKADTKKSAPKAEAPKKAVVETGTRAISKAGGIDLSMVIREPRITEKASSLSEHGAYVFHVHQSATKPMIARAITARYAVTPVKIAVVTIPTKRRQSRTTGAMYSVGGGKKAVVYLKKGEKIEFV